MSGQSKIETLPNEVLHPILGQLPLQDLKAFRLLNKTLTQLPLRHIFNHVRIFIHPRSASNFEAIAGHEQLCKEVRTLSLDMRMVGGHTNPQTHREWWDFCLQVGKRHCSEFERNALDANYGDYIKYGGDQDEIASFELEHTYSKIQNLPDIRHLEVTGGTGHGSEVPTAQDFTDFKSLWPRIGTVPHWKGHVYPGFTIDKVLTAGLSNRSSLTSLALIGINWDFLRCTTVARRAQWRDGLKTIRHLRLCLRLPNPKPGILGWLNDHEHFVDDYARFLCSPTRLEILDYAFMVEANRTQHEMPWTWYDFEKYQFRAILRRPSFMHHIRELRFAEFVFSPNDFITLLSHNEARTLKKLQFNKVHLNEGSWLIFLRQLAHAADLEEFSLSGWISSEHEGWNALTQEQAAEYYGADVERVYPHQRDEYDYNPDCLVTCEGFDDWPGNFDHLEPLPEEWCIRTLIEDWVTSGGGTRRKVKTNNHPKDPSKWAGWYPFNDDASSSPSTIPSSSITTWHDDSFPLLQGYLPACPVHHAPTPERQKQYRYETRWRTRLNRDFTFVWAEDLLLPTKMRRDPASLRREWTPCPQPLHERDALCPVLLPKDDYVVPEEMVYEDRERGLVVEREQMITPEIWA